MTVKTSTVYDLLKFWNNLGINGSTKIQKRLQWRFSYFEEALFARWLSFKSSLFIFITLSMTSTTSWAVWKKIMKKWQRNEGVYFYLKEEQTLQLWRINQGRTGGDTGEGPGPHLIFRPKWGQKKIFFGDQAPPPISISGSGWPSPLIWRSGYTTEGNPIKRRIPVERCTDYTEWDETGNIKIVAAI